MKVLVAAVHEAGIGIRWCGAGAKLATSPSPNQAPVPVNSGTCD